MTDEELLGQIRGILDEMRPNIQMDGGDVVFDHMEDGAVYVRLEGTCLSSPMVCDVLRESIQERLMGEIPEVHEVLIVKE